MNLPEHFDIIRLEVARCHPDRHGEMIDALSEFGFHLEFNGDELIETETQRSIELFIDPKTMIEKLRAIDPECQVVAVFFTESARFDTDEDEITPRLRLVCPPPASLPE